MPYRLPRRPFPALTLALAVVAVGSCSDPYLASRWTPTPLVVDGSLADWEARAVRFEDEGVEVLALNDGESLYLGLTSDDPHLLGLVTRRGLTLWLDPAGGREEVLGIRFPLASGGSAGGLQPRGEAGAPDPPDAGPASGDLGGMELLGPQPYTRKWVAAPGEGGVAVSLAADGTALVYEAKIPLGRRVGGWGLGVPRGATIGLGLVAPRPNFRGGRGGGPPDGGGRGPGGGGGRPSGGPPGGPGGRGRGPGDMPELDLWTRVRLAPPPAGGAGAGG
jgi:hypothetical protein